ncbi:MAG: ribulose phosphate epimerase [Deltaproteobacteria bacterium]|nr:ribulose phosphate epimerase [Nannocystaceae bacterium]
MHSRALFVLSLASTLACGTKDDSGQTASDASATNTPDDGSTGDGNDEGTDPSNPSASDPSDPSQGGSGDSSGSAETGNMSTTVGFIADPDGGSISVECDVWAQDCPEEEKCMPWANDGGGSWNATRCSPLDPSPAQPGDECAVEGSGVSGIDNCDLSSMCWNVDENNMGTCVPFCMGTEANPVCEDPNTTCSIANEGTLILCLPNCDPLLQDCEEGGACYPVDDAFVCGPDASADMGLYGEPCEFINVCDPGLFCANADVVPDCGASSGCCSAFCDLSDPDASANCPGAAGGQECTPWYEEGQAPPGFDDIGACAIPA